MWQHYNIPILATADFYLFPSLKLALNGWHLCDVTDTTENGMDELKRLSQNGSTNVPNTFTPTGRNVLFYKGTIFKEM
jgi:hypothetical protein